MKIVRSAMRKEKMKRILILAPFYPPNIGGAETFAEGLAKFLSKNNFVTVLAFKSFDGKGSNDYLCFDEMINDKEWKTTGDLEVFRMDWGFKMGKAWSGTGIKNFFRIVPKMLWEAIRICRVRKPDIVLCNGLNSALVGSILKVFFKVRVGCILLALYEFEDIGIVLPNFGFFGSMARRVLKRMDKIYVEGENGKQDILPLGIQEDKIVKFQHWVDQEIFKPEIQGGYFMVGEDKDGLLDKIDRARKIRVLFIGRPIFEKGMHLIKHVESVMKGDVDFEYIQDVPHEELPKHYQGADVLVVPSLYAEGFVRVVAEASSCGCAIITSNMGSLPEMVKDFGWAIPAMAGNFDLAIYVFNKDREKLKKAQSMALEYAKENFSEKNAEVFLGICE